MQRTTPAVSFLLAALLFAQFASPQEKQPAADPLPPNATAVISITATDAHGTPVQNVSKETVTVLDGKESARLIDVRKASDTPLDLGIVLLASKKKFDQEQAAAIDLAQKILRPGVDRTFVIAAGGDKSWSNPNIAWITDPSAVVTAIHGLDKNTGLPDLFNFQLSTAAAGVDRKSIQTYNAGTGFSAYSVIWAMMKTDPRPVRRAVVIFRSAVAHSPGYGAQTTQAIEDTHKNMILTAQSMGISFYTIGVDDQLSTSDTNRNRLDTTYMPTHSGGDDGSARKYDQDLSRSNDLQYSAGRQNVDRIANETGGCSYWTSKKNFQDAVSGITSDIQSQYLVIFAKSTSATAPPVHPIKVEVAGSAHVLAPRAYVATGGQ
jgi:VWFA-related protein